MPINFEEDVTVEVDNLMCSCDHTTFVAKLMLEDEEDGDREAIIIGKVCVKKKTWFMTEIKHVIVREEYRRQGVATFLMNYVMTQNTPGTENKVIFTPIVAGTINMENQDGQMFLASLGFLPCVPFMNPATRTNLLFLVKSLSPIPES